MVFENQIVFERGHSVPMVGTILDLPFKNWTIQNRIFKMSSFFIEIEIVYFYSHHMTLTGLDFRTRNQKDLLSHPLAALSLDMLYLQYACHSITGYSGRGDLNTGHSNNGTI